MRNHFLSLPAEIIEAARWTARGGGNCCCGGVADVAAHHGRRRCHHRGQRMERIPVAVPDVRRRIGGTTADRSDVSQQAEGVTNWGPVMAVTLLAMLPILLVFIALQRQMIKGLTSGAVKG